MRLPLRIRRRIGGATRHDAVHVRLGEMHALLLDMNHHVVRLEARVGELGDVQRQLQAYSLHLREFADVMCGRIESATALIEQREAEPVPPATSP